MINDKEMNDLLGDNANLESAELIDTGKDAVVEILEIKAWRIEIDTPW